MEVKAGNAKHQRRVIELAKLALGLPAPEQESFLRLECGDDLSLYLEVCVCMRNVEEETGSVQFVEGFRAGSVVGGRFRIVRKIGMGGMGLVYEAIDERLDRRVALKCAKSGHQMSLPPEARTAREVSHYNVCKVYDLHTEMGENGETTFLSMEYIAGETLSERIKQKGPMKPDQALGIVRQLCAGLAQAHQQHVIHGDLKLANVLLTKENRAVLTDFGLARFSEPDGSRILSRNGGTLDYMAPELLIGEPASVASDIYAMGVLFHALLTGSTPGRTRTMKRPEATATLLEVEDPTQWDREVQALPKPWAQVVRRCLEPMPEKRFGSVAEMMAGLEPPRSTLKWVGSAAALVLMAAALYWNYTKEPNGPLVRLAVLPIEAEAGLKKRMTPVAVDIAERLSGVRRNFVVIAPTEAAQNQVTGYEKSGSVLGATHALETQLKEAGGQLSVEARVVEVETGRAVRSLSASYQAGDTATLAKALLGTVNLGLNLKPGKSQETVADAAYGAYAVGMSTLRQDPRQVDAAIPMFEEAMRLDAKSALPYAAMAEAYVQKYRNGDGTEWLERAAQMAVKAVGLSPDSMNVLVSSGKVAQQKGRYEEAIADFSRAARMDPANPMVWRTIGDAYQSAGREAEAIATYKKAIEVEPNAYQSYYFLGNFYLGRSQWREAEEMYRKTIAIAPGLASAQMNLGLGLKQQGKYAEAEKALLLVQKLRPSARLMLNLGALYYEQARYGEALKNFEESAKMGPVPAALNRNLGDALRQLGKVKEARAEYAKALVKSEEELTTNPRASGSRARLALVAARLGDSARARFEVAQVLSMEGVSATARTDAVQALEVMGQREKALEALKGAPKGLIEEVGRNPDLKPLREDARFLLLTGRP